MASQYLLARRKLRKKYTKLNRRLQLPWSRLSQRLKSMLPYDSWSATLSNYFQRSGQRRRALVMVTRELTEIFWSLRAQGTLGWALELRPGHLRPEFLVLALQRRFPRAWEGSYTGPPRTRPIGFPHLYKLLGDAYSPSWPEQQSYKRQKVRRLGNFIPPKKSQNEIQARANLYAWARGLKLWAMAPATPVLAPATPVLAPAKTYSRSERLKKLKNALSQIVNAESSVPASLQKDNSDSDENNYNGENENSTPQLLNSLHSWVQRGGPRINKASFSRKQLSKEPAVEILMPGQKVEENSPTSDEPLGLSLRRALFREITRQPGLHTLIYESLAEAMQRRRNGKTKSSALVLFQPKKAMPKLRRRHFSTPLRTLRKALIQRRSVMLNESQNSWERLNTLSLRMRDIWTEITDKRWALLEQGLSPLEQPPLPDGTTVWKISRAREDYTALFFGERLPQPLGCWKHQDSAKEDYGGKNFLGSTSLIPTPKKVLPSSETYESKQNFNHKGLRQEQRPQRTLRRDRGYSGLRYRIFSLIFMDEMEQSRRWLVLRRSYRYCGYRALLEDLMGLLTPVRSLSLQLKGRSKTHKKFKYNVRPTERAPDALRMLYAYLDERVNKNEKYNYLRRNEKRKPPKKTRTPYPGRIVEPKPRRSRRLLVPLDLRFGSQLRSLLLGSEEILDRLDAWENIINPKDLVLPPGSLRHFRWGTLANAPDALYLERSLF